MRIVDVCAEIEPFLGRKIRPDTHRITFETGGLERPLLVEIAQRSEIATVLTRAVDRDLILLTDRTFRFGLVEPALVVFRAGIFHDLAVGVEKLPDLLIIDVIDIVRAEYLACKAGRWSSPRPRTEGNPPYRPGRCNTPGTMCSIYSRADIVL